MKARPSGSRWSCPWPSRSSTRSFPTSRSRKARVLVADQDPDSRQVLCELLEGWGLRPTVAPSLHRILPILQEAAAENPFRAAIIDYVGPDDVSGFRLAAKIRRDSSLEKVALLLLTSGGEGTMEQNLETFGFDAYLTKPAGHSLLLDTLTSICDARTRGRIERLVTEQGIAEKRSAARRRARRREEAPGFRALLVGDNEVNQEVACGMLEVLGHRCAANSQIALELFDPAVHDLVFMDCQMPVMDGYEAAAELRRRYPGEGRVPIIALTAHAMLGDRERCLAAGMDDYISKPLALSALKAVIERWWPPPEGRSVTPDLHARAGAR